MFNYTRLGRIWFCRLIPLEWHPYSLPVRTVWEIPNRAGKSDPWCREGVSGQQQHHNKYPNPHHNTHPSTNPIPHHNTHPSTNHSTHHNTHQNTHHNTHQNTHHNTHQNTHHNTHYMKSALSLHVSDILTGWMTTSQTWWMWIYHIYLMIKWVWTAKHHSSMDQQVAYTLLCIKTRSVTQRTWYQIHVHNIYNNISGLSADLR